MSSTENHISLKARLICILLFGPLSCFSLALFSVSFYHTIIGMINNSPVIEFSKSLMYFLGAGTGAFSFFVIALFRKKITKKSESILSRIIILCLAIMIIFPQIMSFVLNSFIHTNHYYLCEEVSVISSKYNNYFYTADIDTCISLIEKKHEDSERDNIPAN